ncbi:MAG: SDR family oxidoreductase, partial [Parvibaculales bacterium]
MPHMLFFGFGYCAAALAPLLAARGWQLSASCRDDEKAARLQAQNITPVHLGAEKFSAPLSAVTHILLSAAPTESGDPALPYIKSLLNAQAEAPQWVGYLSTTGVYGDHGGAWIDEDTPPGAVGARGQRRVDAEAAWAQLAAAQHVPMHYFRLAGIYGPGRNQLRSVQNGTARRIDKPGQVFSRIHVDDIAQILLASIDRPQAGRAYSVCDDEPAPPQEVVAFAAALLGVTPPPLTPFAEAELSPMARSFYGDNKRIRNERLKQELGVSLRYPT